MTNFLQAGCKAAGVENNEGFPKHRELASLTSLTLSTTVPQNGKSRKNLGKLTGNGPANREQLLRSVAKSASRKSLKRALPYRAESLRWGFAVAGPQPAEVHALDLLCRLLDDGNTKTDRPDADLFTVEAEAFGDLVQQATTQPTAAVAAISWAYALPELASLLQPTLWWRMLEELQVLCQSALDQATPESWQRLVLAGELGAVLANRLPDLPSCQPLAKASQKAFDQWTRAAERSKIVVMKHGGVQLRLFVASLLRQSFIRDGIEAEGVRKSQRKLARSLLDAAIVLTRPDGACAFSRGTTAGDSATDRNDRRLWDAAARWMDAPGLQESIECVLHKPKQKDAKQKAKHASINDADFPEAYAVEPDASLTAWRPGWKHSHGRVALHYADGHVDLEVGTGKANLLLGRWESKIKVGDQWLVPEGGWEQNCWFTDDEVHYFELQRVYQRKIRVQRQLMLMRDENVLLMAEAVLGLEGQPIEYETALPLGDGISASEEKETRELLLADAKKPRAVVIPLGLNEWRIARAPGSLTADQGHLRLASKGMTRLDVATAWDLDANRFDQPRTWRQLTVAENLQIVGRDVAVGYRLQLNTEQWLFYRTLATAGNRTVMGKNLSIEFYAGRFDPEEGFYEDLVNIESEDE